MLWSAVCKFWYKVAVDVNAMDEGLPIQVFIVIMK